MPKIKRAVAAACAVALLAPTTAFAASGSEQTGYAGSNNVVAGLPQGSGGDSGTGGGPTAGGPTGTVSSSRGSGGDAGVRGLPFTGLDLAVIGGAGVWLLAMGLGLRRLTYRPTRF